MLAAWLAGDVPHAVFADWCEERGIAFARRPSPAIHRRRHVLASTSNSGRSHYPCSHGGAVNGMRGVSMSNANGISSPTARSNETDDLLSGSRTGYQFCTMSQSRSDQ